MERLDDRVERRVHVLHGSPPPQDIDDRADPSLA